MNFYNYAFILTNLLARNMTILEASLKLGFLSKSPEQTSVSVSQINKFLSSLFHLDIFQKFTALLGPYTRSLKLRYCTKPSQILHPTTSKLLTITNNRFYSWNTSLSFLFLLTNLVLPKLNFHISTSISVA
jgi:hypothetical protein